MKKAAPIEVLFSELPFPQRVGAAKAAGFDFIELWTWDHLDLDEVAALTKAHGISVSAMSGDKDESLVAEEDRSAYLARIARSLEAARKVSCPVLVLHSNALAADGHVMNHYTDRDDGEKYDTMLSMLKELAPMAEGAGITLVLEALNPHVEHRGNFLIHTEQSARLVEAVGSPNVKLLYDVYHMQISEGNLCDTLTKYIEHVGYIHVADVPGRHEPGTGEINYHNVFAHLRKLNYGGTVGFELWPSAGTEQAVAAIASVWS